MGFLITALVLIALAVLFVLLGVGLALVLGLVLVIAVIAVVISFVFGGGSTLSFVQDLNKGSEVPDKFNACLIQEQPEHCLKEWTNWDEDKLEVIKQLADQVKRDLGERGSSRSQQYSNQSVNGKAIVTLEMQTDFAKKKAVREHYVLGNKKGELRIEELKWDY